MLNNQNLSSKYNIDSVRKACVLQTKMICSMIHYHLSEEEINIIANCAVVDWMYRWLQKDTNARQTIHSFSIKRYIPNDELSQNEPFLETEETKSKNDRLLDAHRLFKAMVDARVKQYAQESNLKHPKESKLEKKGTPQSFLTLRFLDLLAQNKLELYRMMLFRDKALVVSSDKGSNVSLENNYEIYNSIFSDIKKMSNQKEYVISCLQIHRFEVSNRFQFIAKMAKHMHEYDILTNDPKICNAVYVVGRFANEFEIADSYDILNYDAAVEAIFSDDKVALKHQYMLRHFLYDIRKTLKKEYPLTEAPKWTSSTYKDAYDFFKNDYPIAEKYTPVVFEKNGRNKESTHNNIITLYNFLPTLDEYREAMDGYRKR